MNLYLIITIILVENIIVFAAALWLGCALTNASWSEEWQRRKQIDKSWKGYNQDHFRNS